MAANASGPNSLRTVAVVVVVVTSTVDEVGTDVDVAGGAVGALDVSVPEDPQPTSSNPPTTSATAFKSSSSQPARHRTHRVAAALRHPARPPRLRLTLTGRATGRGGAMQAIVQDEYGEPEDVLRLEEIDPPEFGDDEVLLDVEAAAVHRGDWHAIAGLPYPIRLAGFGLRAPKHRVPGSEVAGRVQAVGKDVTTLHPGDEVFGVAAGSFAEYAPALARKLAPKPERLTFEQAAAVPVSGLTALHALRDHGHVQRGQRVLVIGASGGVGTYAVQIAKTFGAEVTGVCSTAKVDLVRSIGADHVIDYTRADITDDGRRHDVIIDIGGNRSLAQLRRALTPRGTLVITGGETGGRWLGGTDRQLRALVLSPFVSQKLRTFISSENNQDLLALTELIEAGSVTPVVDKAYALRDVPAAVSYVSNGHARGKVAITV